ncbi:MAG: CbiX/SirB N-terminal domain-containing protein, partial [Thermosynechococcaceae cyanobacterium]
MSMTYANELVLRSQADLSTSLKDLKLPPLPLQRPLLMIGHGTRNDQGRQCFLDFAAAYQALDTSRPVFPCFLELTGPSIKEVVAH